jgi:hemerythrin superfamily protein
MPDTDTDTDLVEVLLDQHTQIRELLIAVAEQTGAARETAFTGLVRLLAVHEAAEEQVLHPVARVRLPDGDEVADARIREEEESKRLLRDLERMGTGHDDFDTQFARLRELVLEHAANEEHKEFPGVREHFDEHERALLGKALKAAEALSPTHPHPRDPNHPPANMLVGPMVALADRARDLVKDAIHGLTRNR